MTNENKGNFTKIPARINIKKTYELYSPVLEEIMSKIKNRLIENLKLSSQPTYKARIKSFGSYYKKLLRQHPQEAAESNNRQPP